MNGVSQATVDALDGIAELLGRTLSNQQRNDNAAEKLKGFLHIRKQKACFQSKPRDFVYESVNRGEIVVNQNLNIGIKSLGDGLSQFGKGPAAILGSAFGVQTGDPFFDNDRPVVLKKGRKAETMITIAPSLWAHSFFEGGRWPGMQITGVARICLKGSSIHFSMIADK